MSVKNPVKFDGMYYGNLSSDMAQAIKKVTQSQVIPNFKNTIFLFPEDIVQKALKEGISVRQYLKANNLSASDYIGALRDYQTVGAAFLYLSSGSIISDGVGLGKTVVISALLNILSLKHEMKGFILAVEKAALKQTHLELLSKTGLHVVMIPPEAKKLQKVIDTTDWSNVDGIVITHNTLCSPIFNKFIDKHTYRRDGGGIGCSLFDVFILDESAIAKNSITTIHTASTRIARMMLRNHCMNATLYEMDIMDIYNQLELVNPHVLPRKTYIKNKYCVFGTEKIWTKTAQGPVQKEVRKMIGYKNTDEFKESLKLFIFGRYIEDEKNEYEVHFLLPTLDQQLAINSGLRYPEVLNCPSLLPRQYEKKGMAVRYELPFDKENNPKLRHLIKLVEQYKDKKIMIYTFHKEAQCTIKEECEALGLNCLILNGAITSPNKRQEIMDGFNKKDYTVIITNVKKSLNLYDGDVCILFSMESNPAKLEQIRGRIERNVDKKVKLYIMLVYRFTGEFRLFEDKLVTRGVDAKKLSTDAKSAIDYFLQGKHFYINE